MSTALPEKPTVPQLVNKFLAFYESERFITVFSTACHLSVSCTKLIRSTADPQICLHKTKGDLRVLTL
jgi:hypothetical protein